jgi:flavin-dependent dehydrogenase
MQASVSEQQHDVVIIGGGFIGCLAALMMRKRGLRVAVLESRAAEQPLKAVVGEALTEGTSVFLHHEIGLGDWLSQHAFRKFGFDFVMQPRDQGAPKHLDGCHELLLSLTPLERIPAAFPKLIPTYHVNRPLIDAEVRERAQAAGATFLFETNVREVELGDDGSNHVHCDGPSGPSTVSGRFVLDCSGRRRMLAKQLGISHPMEGLDTAAIWTRFTNVRSDPEFWQTFRGIDRRKHTIHWGGPGFWFWWIHIDDDTTSVGVSFDRNQHQVDVKAEDHGFWEMVGKFPALAEALAGARPVERFQYYAHLAHRTEHWVASRGYAIVGDASAFADALYSVGIEMACRQLVAVAPVIMDVCAGRAADQLEVDRLNREHALMQDSVRLLNKFKYEHAWHQPHILMQTALYDLAEIAELYHLQKREHWTAENLAMHYRLQWSSEARRRRLVRFMTTAQQDGQRDLGRPLLAKALLPGRLVYTFTWPLWALPKARPYFFIITRAWGYMERLAQRLRLWPDFLTLMAGPRPTELRGAAIPAASAESEHAISRAS